MYFRPRIERLLIEWQEHFTTREAELADQIGAVEQRLDNQITEVTQLSSRQHALTGELAGLEQVQLRCDLLANEFALVADSAELLATLQSLQTTLDQQIARVQNASSRSLATLQREIAAGERDRADLERALATLADNLYLRLQTLLSPDQLDALNRSFNSQVLTLAASEFETEPRALQAWLDENGDRLVLPGLRVSLATLAAKYTQQTPAEIEQRLQEISEQLTRLGSEREAAQDLDAARRERTRLQHDLESQQARLARYEEYRELKSTSPLRLQQMETTRAEHDAIGQQIEQSSAFSRQLRAQERDLQSAVERLRADHRVIVQRRELRRDESTSFAALADLPHQPWLVGAEPGLDQLRTVLEGYHADCAELVRLDQQLETLRAQAHAGGLTKFQFLGGSELEIQRIIEFAAHLPQEAQALERKARSAVVNVTACLRELRDGLLTFQSRMRDFNRLVSRRQLSDLSMFRIEPVEEAPLVEAIGQLISTAEKVESGETFALFDHGTVLDDETLNRAKALLIRVGEEKGCLRVEHLFRLEFVVGKAGRKEESFADIDSAASNGTVLMAKLVTGLALLHLMQDKRHKMQALCYLDEASTLDPRNQRNLIDTAEEFGFALIFASPAPLVTARYCVPISTVDGYNHIGRRSWQILEPIEQAEAL